MWDTYAPTQVHCFNSAYHPEHLDMIRGWTTSCSGSAGPSLSATQLCWPPSVSGFYCYFTFRWNTPCTIPKGFQNGYVIEPRGKSPELGKVPKGLILIIALRLFSIIALSLLHYNRLFDKCCNLGEVRGSLLFTAESPTFNAQWIRDIL